MKKINTGIQYDNLTETEQNFLSDVISSYTNDNEIIDDVDTIKKFLIDIEQTINKNDKIIERLLGVVEYFEPGYANSERLIIELGLSFLTAAQVINIEGISTEDKAIGCFTAFALMCCGFGGLKKLTNEKILNTLYKKLDEVAKKNGKLKGIYKDLDAKVTYFDNISKENYVILK